MVRVKEKPLQLFGSKKYDDTEQVVAIICNLCKKEYGPKTSTRPLMDHINKEHKHNISIK